MKSASGSRHRVLRVSKVTPGNDTLLLRAGVVVGVVSLVQEEDGVDRVGGAVDTEGTLVEFVTMGVVTGAAGVADVTDCNELLTAVEDSIPGTDYDNKTKLSQFHSKQYHIPLH